MHITHVTKMRQKNGFESYKGDNFPSPLNSKHFWGILLPHFQWIWLLYNIMILFFSDICIFLKKKSKSKTLDYSHTWLPSRLQKIAGWGFPVASHWKVTVRPKATTWSRGFTTKWGGSEETKYAMRSCHHRPYSPGVSSAVCIVSNTV